MKPSLNDFNRGFLQTVLDGLWTQWSALGVPGHAGRVPRAAIDPEALLLLTCSLGRYDARMFDEMLGWIVLHERLLDVQRLKNLLRDEGYAGGCVVSAIGAYLSAAKRGGVKWQRLSAVHAGKTWQPEPLFYSLDGGSISVIREPDLDFARQGLHREKIALRDHAQPFNPDQPVNLRLKLRALFGVNSRAETVTFLLLHDQAGTTEIARATGYFKLTVYNTLAEIRLSGLLQTRDTQATTVANQTANVSTPSYMRQIQDAAFKDLGQGTKQLTLQLQPEDMGTVNVVLQVKGKEVQAVISSENKDTVAVIHERLDSIRQALEDQGLKVDRLEVRSSLPDSQSFTQWSGAESHNRDQQAEAMSQWMGRLRSMRSGEDFLAQDMQPPTAGANLAQSGLHIIA